MRAETALLPTQPTTHTSGCHHWRQYLFCEDYSLNSDQLHVYYTLKQEANILFEGKNQRWDLIKTLYAQYFGQPVQVSGKQWMRLGFQGQYPQTDFRGGGILSLQLILSYVKRNRQLVQQMQKDKGNFFFAITAINICFFMKNYFHLADSLIPGRDKEIYCDRRALKNFCQIMRSNEQAFSNMHEAFLTWFYKQKWVQASKQHPETLMQFNKLFEDLKIKIKQIFENYKIQDWNDFITLWKEA